MSYKMDTIFEGDVIINTVILFSSCNYVLFHVGHLPTNIN